MLLVLMSCSNLGTSYVGYLLYEWSAIELRIWNHQLLGRPGKTWETNLHLQWHNLKDLSKSFENQKVLRVLGCHDVIPQSRMNLNKAAQYIQLYTYTNCVLFLAKKKSWKCCSTGALQTGDVLVAATCAVLWCSIPQVHCPCLLGLQCRSRLHKATITEGLFMCWITQLPNQILSGSPESEP